MEFHPGDLTDVTLADEDTNSIEANYFDPSSQIVRVELLPYFY